MPNPKRRHSKARRNRRRAHDHLTPRQFVECPHCHETKLAHQACPYCGYYRGREVVLVEESA
ncbi:MAG: 50S ribosomal protein L32 [Terriglobia bacterium]